MSLQSIHALAGLAQTTPPGPLEELAFGGGLLVFLVVIAVVSLVVNAILTLVIGAPVIAVAADSIRAIGRHASAEPVRSGALGFGTIVGGGIAFVGASFVLQVLIAAGLPESVSFVVLLAGLLGVLGLFGLLTVGEIIAGSALLTRFGGDDDPSLWAALVVAAVGVNLAYLVPVGGSLLAVVLLSVATGAVVDRWWQGRGGDAQPSNRTIQADDD